MTLTYQFGGCLGNKYWPNRVFASLLSVTEVNINLVTMYFGGQQQMGQIDFCKKLAKTLIFNTHYNEDDDKTPEKKQKQQDSSHCLIMLPKCKKFSGTQIVTANSEYQQHKSGTCQKGYVPIVYAPQESTSVQNVSVIILPVLKTIFPHQAEIQLMKTISSTQNKLCNNLRIILNLFLCSITYTKILVANDRNS